VQREAVISQAIRSVGYRAGTLEIEFVHGDVYRYLGVPQLVYLQFMRAESKGAFFNERIRDCFEVRGPV